MRSDDEIRIKASEAFPNNLNQLEQEKWLEIATSSELEASKKSAHDMGHSANVNAIKMEQSRRIDSQKFERVVERLRVLEDTHWTATAGFWVAAVALIVSVLTLLFC